MHAVIESIRVASECVSLGNLAASTGPTGKIDINLLAAEQGWKPAVEHTP